MMISSIQTSYVDKTVSSMIATSTIKCEAQVKSENVRPLEPVYEFLVLWI